MTVRRMHRKPTTATIQETASVIILAITLEVVSDNHGKESESLVRHTVDVARVLGKVTKRESVPGRGHSQFCDQLVVSCRAHEY